MKVIDMTNVEAFTSLRSGPIKRASSLIGIKHKVKVDSLDLHQIEDDRAYVPKLLLSYEKFVELKLERERQLAMSRDARANALMFPDPKSNEGSTMRQNSRD